MAWPPTGRPRFSSPASRPVRATTPITPRPVSRQTCLGSRRASPRRAPGRRRSTRSTRRARRRVSHRSSYRPRPTWIPSSSRSGGGRCSARGRAWKTCCARRFPSRPARTTSWRSTGRRAASRFRWWKARTIPTCRASRSRPRRNDARDGGSALTQPELNPMTRRLVGALSCAVLLMPCAAASGQDATTVPATTVIRGGWLFDAVGDGVRRNRGIVMVGGKLLSVDVAPTARDLAGANVITLGDNDYILPGLFDLHAHYNMNLLGKGRHDETAVQPVIWLANGVTSTFPAGEYDPEDMMALRQRIEHGEQNGPRLYDSGPYYGRVRQGWNPEMTPAEVYKDVDSWFGHGVRAFKAKGIGPVQLRPLIERGHWHGCTVTGHLVSGFNGSVNPKDAILMGIDRIEHFMGGDALPATQSAYASYDHLDVNTPEVRDIIQLYISHHVNYDATMTAYGYAANRGGGEAFADWMDGKEFLTPYVQSVVAARPKRNFNVQFDKIYHLKPKELKAFYDAGGGALITLGTDLRGRGQAGGVRG